MIRDPVVGSREAQFVAANNSDEDQKRFGSFAEATYELPWSGADLTITPFWEFGKGKQIVLSNASARINLLGSRKRGSKSSVKFEFEFQV